MLAGLRDVLYLGFDDGDVLPVEGPDGIGLPTAVRLGTSLDWGVVRGAEVVVGGGAIRLPDEEVHVVRLWRPSRVRTVQAAGHGRLTVLDGLVAGAAAALGLGPGLTPAADDELCGLLLVAHAVALPVDVDDSLSRTTDLSASLVRAAAAGYAVPAAVRVVDAGIAGRRVSAPDRDAVLALGDSSGGALLSGIVRGLDALHEEGQTVA